MATGAVYNLATLEGVTLTKGIDINDAGQVLALGCDATKQHCRSYLLTPVETPLRIVMGHTTLRGGILLPGLALPRTDPEAGPALATGCKVSVLFRVDGRHIQCFEVDGAAGSGDFCHQGNADAQSETTRPSEGPGELLFGEVAGGELQEGRDALRVGGGEFEAVQVRNNSATTRLVRLLPSRNG